MPHLRRRELLAYLVGAGVAGTILVVPYVLRDVAYEVFLPGRARLGVPVFLLLPVLWGAWNVLWERLRPAMEVGLWGGLLGALAATLANIYLWGTGDWFPAAALLFVFLPVVYYLLWHFVIGPLNDALGVEGPRARA